MKKAGLLLILGILILTVFATAACAEDPPVSIRTPAAVQRTQVPGYDYNTPYYPSSRTGGQSEGIVSTIGETLTTIQGLIGKIFNMVSNSPTVWLKVLFGIAIFVVIFQLLQMVHVIDRKTGGILAFVVAFATLAVTPDDWIYLAISMYSGLIMVAALGVPLVLGLIITAKAIKKKAKAMGMTIIAIGWVFYLMMLSTAFSTLKAKGYTSSGPLEWFQSIAFLVSMCLILFCLWMAASGRGKQKMSDINLGVGGLLGKLNPSGWFGGGGGKEPDFGPSKTLATNIIADIGNALSEATGGNDRTCEHNLNEAARHIALLIDDKHINQIDKRMKKAFKQMKTIDKNQAKTAKRSIDLAISIINSLMASTEKMSRELNTGTLDIADAAREIPTLQGEATTIKTKIEEAETIYDAEKAKNP